MRLGSLESPDKELFNGNNFVIVERKFKFMAVANRLAMFFWPVDLLSPNAKTCSMQCS